MIKRFFLSHSNIIVSRWVVIMIDIILLNAAIIIANLLRFDFVLSEIAKYHLSFQMLMVTAMGVISLLATSAHLGIIRHTSQNDLLRILKSVTLLVIMLMGINYAILLLDYFHHTLTIAGNNYYTLIPNSVLIIFFPVSLFFLMFLRMFIKLAYYNISSKDVTEKSNVLVYGAGKEGVSVLRALSMVQSSPYRVLGFMDDMPGKIDKSIEGLRIYNPKTVTNKFILKNNISEIILAMPNLVEEHKTEIYNRLLNIGITIKSIPPVHTWINGELNAKQIQNININDLLQRAPIRLDNQEVLKGIFGKTVMVTGAAGSIGSELARQLLYFNPAKVVFVDQAESPLFELEQDLTTLEQDLEKRSYHQKVLMSFIIADVSNELRIGEIIRSVKPHLLYHAAAYKHVPLMESHPLEAIRVNVLGTCFLADAAVEAGVEKFVMISTDKAVNPTSIMGASKRLAEIYIQSLNGRPGHQTAFITTRFGNVLGSNGSVTLTFKKQIQAGGPVTVTHPEITRYFMTIPEACQLVFEAAAMGRGGEIFIFDMGKPVKIVDLARNMIRLSGFVPEREIKIVYSGLRPGEKLYEELLADSENTMKTHHPKIMIAKVRSYTFAEVKEMLSGLIDCYQEGDRRALVKFMKLIIPEYISNNSVYRLIDFDMQAGRESKKKAKNM